MKHVRLIIDFSIITRENYNQYQIQGDENLEEQFKPFGMWRHMVLQSLLDLKNSVKPDEIILACDHESWRKDVFPFYKSNRKYDGLEEYFFHVNNFLIELEENFPFKILRLKGLESDDIITIFVLHKNNEINVIGSNDSDLYQLMLYPNTIYYNLKQKRLFELSKEEIKENVLLKLLKGDPGDGIPNIYTNELVKGIRQKSITQSIIEEFKIHQDRFLGSDNKIKERFERNKKLILLTKNNIPLDLQNEMLNIYKNYIIKSDRKKLYNYLDEWKMERMKERIMEFDNLWG